MNKAGLYVPGGRAAYPSTVLMNAIPAQVAGVKQVVMVTPPGPDGHVNPLCWRPPTWRASRRSTALAAPRPPRQAAGTESIPAVDVITGPGNLFVTLAKKSVYGRVGIDSLAGPSEVLVIADDSASAELVAADLVAQAEHDPLAAAILLTTSHGWRRVPEAIAAQLEDHPRREVTEASIRDWGLMVLCDSLEQAASSLIALLLSIGVVGAGTSCARRTHPAGRRDFHGTTHP